jgi:hypothetical protein
MCVRTCLLFRTVSEVQLWMCSIKGHQDALKPATRHVLTRVAKCTEGDGGVLENVLYWVNCTNFVT